MDVAPGRSVIALLGDEVHHLLVHHLSPQGAPVGQQQGPLVVKAQLGPGLLPGVTEEIAPHRSAGDHHLLGVVVVGSALLKAHHHPVHHLGKRLGGQAGHGVGLVDGGGDVPAGRLTHHGEGSIASCSHHQVRPELIQNGLRLLFGLLHVDEGPEIMGHIGRRKGAAEIGNGDRANLVPLLGHQLVLHSPVRSHKEDAAAGVLFLENTGQGHSRIDVSRGSAAGKEHVHEITSEVYCLNEKTGRPDL